jgi:hypothetical protein
MSSVQKCVATVLRRMADAVENDPEDAEVYAYELEELLDNMHGHDFFGTEGQCDPRGDFRNGEWSMWNVEGVED